MPRKLEKFTVHRFRQLEEIEFNGFAAVNLLVGENSSGKTSILESLSLFARPLDPLELINTARRREIKSSRERLLDGLRWLFPQQAIDPGDPYFHGQIAFAGHGLHQTSVSIEYAGQLGDAASAVSYEGDDDEGSLTITEPPDAYSSRRGARICMRCETEQKTLYGDHETRKHTFEIWEDERYVSRAPVESSQLPVATLSPVSHRVELIQTRQLSEAILVQQEFGVIEALKLVDPDIEGLEIISRSGISPALWVRHRQAGFSPVSVLGDGTRRVLSMALQLHSVRNGILLIDEIETAIHKDALARIFRWLVDACRVFNVQLFATTHSLEAIDAILTAQIDEPDQIVAFHMPERGEGTIKRFDGDVLENLRFERGLDIR